MAVFNISKIQIESNSQRLDWQCRHHYRCVQYFKDTNREQFTTVYDSNLQRPLLCSIFQRYKSRAIHNTQLWKHFSPPAVFNISKIQIESNSQQIVCKGIRSHGCVQYFKDTNREQFTTCSLLKNSRGVLCSIFQRYKSRAIHNIRVWAFNIFQAVFNISKIQIESNSQHLPCICPRF